jgi:hypothetical protein
MKKLQHLWLNIKIRSAWRLQFILGLIKRHISEKYFPYDENNN